jgi:hypothetical protein
MARRPAALDPQHRQALGRQPPAPAIDRHKVIGPDSIADSDSITIEANE